MARVRQTGNQSGNQSGSPNGDQVEPQEAGDGGGEGIREQTGSESRHPLRLMAAGHDPARLRPLEGEADSASLTPTSPMQVVSDALKYFGRHFPEPIPITELARLLGTSEDYLTFSFDRIRGMTPAEALQEHRLNRLFTALSDQPRQGLALAIRACGLGQTVGVVALFEQTFGIDMPLFLLTCRRAAEDRQFRRQHPEPEALVLPI